MHNFIDPVVLLETRIEDGETQAELAVKIGISPQYLSQILKRDRKPSANVLDFLKLEKVITYQPRVEDAPKGKDRRRRNRRAA